MSCKKFEPWSENPNVCATCKELKCPAKACIDMEAALVKVFRSAIVKAYPAIGSDVPKLLITKGRDGADYQCNNSPGLVKQLSKLSPPIKSDKDKVAADLIAAVDRSSGLVGDAVASRGFINIKIGMDYVQNAVQKLVNDGVQPPKVDKQTIVVDFSSPNIAKKMHVGHLRSTIIGDTICRLFEFCEHDVKRVNHVGDWGTQFGMLIAHLKSICPDFLTSPPDVTDIAQFYKDAKARFDAEPEFKKESHREVVKLQSGDETNLKGWKLMCDLSREEFSRIYERLDVHATEMGESFYNDKIPSVLDELEKKGLTHVHEGATLVSAVDWKVVDDSKFPKGDMKKVAGFALVNPKGKEKANPVLLKVAESVKVAKQEGDEWLIKAGKEFKPVATAEPEDFDKFLVACEGEKLFGTPGKAPLNAEIAAELTRLGSLKDGKVAVPAFSIPLIARKSDGGFSYDTTDLAAAYYRSQVMKAHRVVIITDKSQGLHFDLIYRAARDAGWDAHADGVTKIRYDHVGFGVVCGPDKKRYRTRSGETAALADLLEEGVETAFLESKKRQDTKAEHFKELADKGELREEFVPFSDEELKANAEVTGIGAIKYCDLRQNRSTDYVFDKDKMCSLNGNTVMSMLYTYARCCSLARKANVDDIDTIKSSPISLVLPCERSLAVHLLKFPGVVSDACESLMLHGITDFLYELTSIFGDCYNNKEWKVLGHDLQNSRLLLCHATATTLKKGLDLLGIKTVTRI